MLENNQYKTRHFKMKKKQTWRPVKPGIVNSAGI